ncbi:MAG TPA: bifunctional methylenetetrahydrofolate dehydrogenase/methenyltetrahydrofolate cyclohydrolase, partial [Sphaerochaeta sp.]|nr:bifunctional methylenetetrahydrofolate dehydrogenase/methenyltetrahydrofolate cyclohydrolase [Sphaerochaeta sp.]
MVVLSGKELSSIVKTQVAAGTSAFEKRFSRRPCLAVVLVGENPASLTYVRNKHKGCQEVGFDFRDCNFPADISQETLLECVAELNADPTVDGILVQMPLPKHL